MLTKVPQKHIMRMLELTDARLSNHPHDIMVLEGEFSKRETIRRLHFMLKELYFLRRLTETLEMKMPKYKDYSQC